MGRGRQKAKATKQAREMKYFTPATDYSALQRELAGPSAVHRVDIPRNRPSRTTRRTKISTRINLATMTTMMVLPAASARAADFKASATIAILQRITLRVDPLKAVKARPSNAARAALSAAAAPRDSG